MPGPMTRGPLVPPTEADIDRVVEAQGASIDKVVQMNTPMGRYSEARLKLLRDALQACLDTLGTGVTLPEAFPVPKGQGVAPMPTPLVEALLTVRSAYDAWAATMEEGSELMVPSPMDLTDDSNIALAVPAIKKLAADKAFKKWAKTAQPPPEEPPAAMPQRQPSAGASAPSSMEAELSALFGS